MPKEPISLKLELGIHEGKREELESTVSELIQQVEAQEPGTVTYEFFLSEDERTMTALDWYEDEQAAIAHLTGAPVGTFLPKLLELADVERLDIYGEPSGKLSEVLENFPVTAIHRREGGFMR